MGVTQKYELHISFKVKEQADRFVWMGYNLNAAARDAIFYQTDNNHLMKKIIIEDLDFDDTVKYGLAMEQGAWKVDQIRNQARRKEEERVAALEEQVRALQAKEKSTRKLVCRTYTRPTHEEGKCHDKKVECYACAQMGHFKGSSACNITEKKDKNKKKKKQKRHEL